MAKAYVGTARLEQTDSDLPGVLEGGMSGRKEGRKDSESLEPLGGRISEDGPGQKNPVWSRRPLG